MGTDTSMHFSLLLAVLPLVLSQAHALDRCPDGWMEAHGGINLGCLHFGHPEDQQMSHDDAKAYCAGKNEDAYLVEVRTAVQQTFLDPVMKSSEGFTWRATECSDMAGVVCQLDAPPA